ncbi:MAG: Retron-type reverse transcriptase [Syntrophomonadaceae bacterium]|nr:Retron-type reverse transcriptase [Syntrophomonadaceae bacterium]
MMLSGDSLKWAVDFIYNHSDGDLFPKIAEIDSIITYKDEFVALIEDKDLSQFPPGACRRFIVPKDEISYRQATQLDPQDSIILTAIIHQYGIGIERRRLDRNIVFSYRFSPDINYGLYSAMNSWNDFWTSAFRKSSSFEYVLYCDIADFYNQIYHHIVENQLIESAFPNQVMKWVIGLLESTTANVSRGVPIGPHPIHLLAEAAMIPIDNSISIQGLEFLRYADDILVFCDSKQTAKNSLAKVASILDKQQRLMLQRHKTKTYTVEEFRNLCSDMIEDRPISKEEDEILKLIRKYSGGNPYRTITYNEISDEDWKSVSDEIISNIIYEYINQEDVDYIRLRWFYRRLAQLGHPGAIEVSLREIAKLSPCFANICSYLGSVQSIDEERWKYIGERLLELLDSEDVVNNEFFRLSILSLFTKNRYINHFSRLVRRYPTSESFVQREILLAAYQNSAFDWLREHKENFQGMDPWQKMAFIYGCSGLPKDEKKYFINKLSLKRPFDIILAKWAKNI